MANYARTTAGLVSQLQSELNRTDFSAQFLNPMDSAIQNYNHEWFYFNQATSATTTATTANDDTDSVSDLQTVRRVIITTSSSHRLLMEKVSAAEIDELSVSTSITGRPWKYAVYGTTIRWYPIPDAVYTVAIKGTAAIAALTAVGTDTNVWLSDPLAYDFVRHYCRRDFYLNINKDGEKAATADKQMSECLSLMRAETNRRESSGKIKATAF